MGDEDLITTEGVDDEGTTRQPAEPDPAGPGGALPDEPPASPAPTDVPRPGGPGQEVEEGEG